MSLSHGFLRLPTHGNSTGGEDLYLLTRHPELSNLASVGLHSSCRQLKFSNIKQSDISIRWWWSISCVEPFVRSLSFRSLNRMNKCHGWLCTSRKFGIQHYSFIVVIRIGRIIVCSHDNF